jgi:pilus assembly protein CpaC
MTEGGVLKQRTKSSHPRLWVRKGRTAATRRAVCVAMFATAAAFALVQAAAPAWAARKAGPCHAVTEQVSAIKVTLNKSRTLCFSDPFSTAVIGAPEIADVLPMTDSMLYVQGKKVGATNISIFDQQRRLVSVIDLDVTPDTTSLQSKIAASTGGRDIAVTSANGEIVLSGEASDGLAAARAVEVAKGLSPDAQVVNAMKVSPSQQVMLKVRILEVDRNAGRDLGISWFGK